MTSPGPSSTCGSGIAASNRHDSGIALRFPRMLRQRTDKPLSEIDSVESVQALLASSLRREGPKVKQSV